MGLFDRIFRGAKLQIVYPPDLQPQIERAMSGLQSLTAAHDGIWQIGQAAWSIDQDAGTFTFASPKGIVATAPVQIVGTYNTQDGTWLWGWDNLSLEPSLTEHARELRGFRAPKRDYRISLSRCGSCPVPSHCAGN